MRTAKHPEYDPAPAPRRPVGRDIRVMLQQCNDGGAVGALDVVRKPLAGVDIR